MNGWLIPGMSWQSCRSEGLRRQMPPDTFGSGYGTQYLPPAASWRWSLVGDAYGCLVGWLVWFGWLWYVMLWLVWLWLWLCSWFMFVSLLSCFFLWVAGCWLAHCRLLKRSCHKQAAHQPIGNHWHHHRSVIIILWTTTDPGAPNPLRTGVRTQKK